MRKKIIIISILTMLVLGQASYAAIEIVPSKDGKGTDGMTRSSISNSYLLCQNMKNAGESLNGTTVLPHLATNADWGANPNVTRYTQTAGLIKKYVDDETNGNNTLGMALAETSGIYPNIWAEAEFDVNYPTPVRHSLFGFVVSYYVSGSYVSGAAHASVTFRPVIWNK